MAPNMQRDKVTTIQNFVLTALLFEKDVGDTPSEHASSHNFRTKMRAMLSPICTEKCQFLPPGVQNLWPQNLNCRRSIES